MAFDLFRQLPMLSPASVQSFLAEAVRLVQTGGLNETRTLQELVEITTSHPDLAGFRRVTAELVPFSDGRGYLISLISRQTGATAIDDGRFRDLIGLSATTRVSISEWATWLFRELQAARAAHEGSGTKRKSPKGNGKK
jgi:hypothetical protein